MRKNNEPLKIRASRAGTLMTDAPGIGLTDNQARTLEEYLARKNGQGKPLTANMENTLAELIAKRDAPFELSQSAKSYIIDLWLRREYGYREPVVTKEMMKGHLCEQDGIELVSDLIPASEFRVKNRESFEDDYFTGTPDIILEKDGYIEDLKSSWTLKTFFEATPGKDYEGQAQVYMHLAGIPRYRLIYALVDTPDEIILQEMKRYFFKFGADEANPEYERICNDLEAMHKVSHIPPEDRMKVFYYHYDPAYMEELIFRVKEARKFYDTLTLVDVAHRYRPEKELQY